MVFLCHYRNKLIFGFKSEGGDTAELGRNMSQETEEDKDGTLTSKLRSQGDAWISPLMFTMQQLTAHPLTPLGCVHGKAA